MGVTMGKLLGMVFTVLVVITFASLVIGEDHKRNPERRRPNPAV